MSKIVFFGLPAHGHFNPTLEIVRELVNRGNEVWYYSFHEFQEKIEGAGAKFISCDRFSILDNMGPEFEERLKKKGLAYLAKRMVDAVFELEDMIYGDIDKLKPDCIVTDSMAYWGKALAIRKKIPFVISNTTFAINKKVKLVKNKNVKEVLIDWKGNRQAEKEIKKLKAKGYPIKRYSELLGGTEKDHVIVYTSKEFQPFSELFSETYSFVGPIIKKPDRILEKSDKKTIYISLGTIFNNKIDFFKNCIEALKDSSYEVIISVGSVIQPEELGELPDNIQVGQRVNQIEVLQRTDVFLSHCGMNSANESLFYEVPMVMFPQGADQGVVADRIAELGAGVLLKKYTAKDIRNAIELVLHNSQYKENAKKISESFKRSGGVKEAVDKIEFFMNQKN